MSLDREVCRCKKCGLVQYRNRAGDCRRCLYPLAPQQGSVLPVNPPTLSSNFKTVARIGQRICQLRESCAMTQCQVHALSRISRSWLSRVESGQMTPSLATLEKISEALGVGLNLFFVPETKGEGLLDDPFIQNLRPFVGQLDRAQWPLILKLLAAITSREDPTTPPPSPLQWPPITPAPQNRS